MKAKSGLSKAAMIYGIVVTLVMIIILGTNLIGSFVNNDSGERVKFASSLINWYDDPTGFFISYLIGYAIVWWKPLCGSIIVMAVSLLLSILNIDNIGFTIFALPAFVVGLLYAASWNDIRKKNKLEQ